MLYRRLLALSLLSLLTVAGCSDDSKNDKNADPVCGNGVIEEGESCDTKDGGAVVYKDNATCVTIKGEGATGDLSCSATCQIVDTACKAPVVENKCGNGVIDDGEECDSKDGTVVYKDNATCVTRKGEGATGDLSCDASCRIVDTACVPKSNPDADCDVCDTEDAFRCDAAGGYSICMANGEKKCWVHDDCAAGKSCDETAKNCVRSCADAADKCDTENAVKCDGENGYAICMEGCWEKDTCPTGSTCDKDAAQICVGKCQANKYTKCGVGGENCVEVNCTSDGAICEEKDGVPSCVPAEFTCDGSVISVTKDNANYKYNCADNANSSDESKRSDILCNSVYACANIGCDGDVLKIARNGQKKDDRDCANLNLKCSDEELACVCDTTDEIWACSKDNKTLVYCQASADESGTVKPAVAIFEDCYDGCDPDNVECIDTNKLCSQDAYSTTDEIAQFMENTACYIQTYAGENYVYWNGAIRYNGQDYPGTAYRPSCNYYSQDDVYVSGEPRCENSGKNGETKCSVNILSNCVKATDADREVLKSWVTFTEDIFHDSNVKIHGGFLHSKIDNGAWVIGENWGSGNEADWNRYMLFSNLGAISNVAIISANIKRGQTGPKKLDIKLLDGDKEVVFNGKSVVATFSDIPVSEATDIEALVRFDSDISNLSIMLSGYEANDASKNGTITIKDLKVISIKGAMSAAPVAIDYM